MLLPLGGPDPDLESLSRSRAAAAAGTEGGARIQDFPGVFPNPAPGACSPTKEAALQQESRLAFSSAVPSGSFPFMDKNADPHLRNRFPTIPERTVMLELVQI